MKELVKKVIQWAEDRNIIEGAKKTDQLHKLYQECGELSDSLCKGKCAKDDIGDITVVLIILAKQSGYVLDLDIDIDMSSQEDRDVRKSEVKIMYFGLMSNVDLMRWGIDDLYLNPIKRTYKSLWHICHDLDYDIKDCLEIAYDDIKDRKGILKNGVFIKEADL